MPSPRKTHIDSLAAILLVACCRFWGFQQVPVKATVAEVAVGIALVNRQPAAPVAP